MDHTVQPLDWAIPIHDAVILCALDAPVARQAYCDKITDIYKNRGSILNGYFKSVGINNANAWRHLQTKIIPVDTNFECQHTALK